MKKLVLFLLLLTALYGVAQLAGGRLNRRPYPNEVDQLVGVLGPIGSQNNPLMAVTHVTTNYTVTETNGLIVVRNPVNFLNHIALPNATNNPFRMFEVFVLGNNTAVLTNADGNTFEGATNVTATSYTLNSNTLARVISTGTNWLVNRIQFGNQ